MFGHPKGLLVLFFTELWERFSYYGMRALLVLYIYASAEDGGLGWTRKDALVLYGWYTMMVYVMSIPGGILADKLLGQKKTVVLGGFLLCAGHLVLAFDSETAFFIGLGLIVLGVGCLKPNISTMVGGLYKDKDERRDKGFMIFYIGINIGAFLAPLVVGYIGENYGWHYGFGVAGIGMLLGQAVYLYGLKYLEGIGELKREPVGQNNMATEHLKKLFTEKQSLSVFLITFALGLYVIIDSIGYGMILITMAPVLGIGVNIYKDELNKVEKDRVIVLLLSFLIVIVFWGAFEQAGGLMNIYTNEKVDRSVFGLDIPASVFQSVNAMFIILFGGIVASFWMWRRNRNKENSSLYKMALGTMVMGLGFLFMSGAAVESGAEPFGKAGLYWIFGAYFLHTIGELCASPVALSFITKLAPVKYASVMMGVYFAATGFGNKLAGAVGELSQSEPLAVVLKGEKSELSVFGADSLVNEDKNFVLKTQLYEENGNIVLADMGTNNDVKSILTLSDKVKKELKHYLIEENASANAPLHTIIRLEKDVEAKKVKANKGDGKDYSGTIEVVEIQNAREFKTFTFITVFTVAFGTLLILFLKKLKKLTHGAEDKDEERVNAKRKEPEMAI